MTDPRFIPRRPRVAIIYLFRRFRRASTGQSLVEVAAFLPIVMLCAAYAVDFGYFFIICANLTSSARSAAEYSIQGYQSPGHSTLPSAGPTSSALSVSALALGDLTGVANSATKVTVLICSKSVGTSGNATKCSSYGPTISGSPSTAVQTDHEAPTFLLNRVDVIYTVEPPIPLSFLASRCFQLFHFSATSQ